jgi:S-adenosylmethionine:tRNA ribosyltransferase-isomerase
MGYDRTNAEIEPQDVRVGDYTYELPLDRIADEPVHPRDSSRLLVWDGSRDGLISHHRFRDLPTLAPPGSLFVVNDSRVVRARIRARRATGGKVEVFLVRPVEPSGDP